MTRCARVPVEVAGGGASKKCGADSLDQRPGARLCQKQCSAASRAVKPVLWCHHMHPLYGQATSHRCHSCSAGHGQSIPFSCPCCSCQAYRLGAERVTSVRLGAAPAKYTAGKLTGCRLFDNIVRAKAAPSAWRDAHGCCSCAGPAPRV